MFSCKSEWLQARDHLPAGARHVRHQHLVLQWGEEDTSSIAPTWLGNKGRFEATKVEQNRRSSWASSESRPSHDQVGTDRTLNIPCQVQTSPPLHQSLLFTFAFIDSLSQNRLNHKPLPVRYPGPVKPSHHSNPAPVFHKRSTLPPYYRQLSDLCRLQAIDMGCVEGWTTINMQATRPLQNPILATNICGLPQLL